MASVETKAPDYVEVEVAPPTYEQHRKRGKVNQVLDLLGSRSTQAVLADAVLTVVLSLYFSIHRLSTLTASRQLSLACAHLARAGSELAPDLTRACSAATATVDAQAASLSPSVVRWFFLLLVIFKATGASCYLGLGKRDSSTSAARACDFVVTSIAFHALIGFSSFLVIPFAPSARTILAFAHDYPLATALLTATVSGLLASAITHAVKSRRQVAESIVFEV